MKLLVILFFGCVASAAVCDGQAIKTTVRGKFVDLGVQITALNLQGTTFTQTPDGTDVVCAVVRGEPAKLLVFDVRSGKLLHRFSLVGARGAWNACTASDASVYVGTDDKGHVYRWIPGKDAVQDLGAIGKDQTFVWDVSPGPDGEIFAGTYPGCEVFAYYPGEGFTNVGHGSVAPGENYVRGLAYDPATKKVFAGVGSHAHLIELDPRTGQKRDILPAEYHDREFVYSVDVVAGKVIAHVSPVARSLVINPATAKVEGFIPNISGQQVFSPKSPYEDAFYFHGFGGLAIYHLATGQSQRINIMGNQQIVGLGWATLHEPDFPDQTLVAMTRNATLVWYNPKTRKVKTIRLNPPPEEVPIQSIAVGPDGRVYCGGYLTGGLSAFDPKTDKSTLYNPINQSESITSLGSKLYLGVYPQARLYAFETTKPWDLPAGNPKLLDTLSRVGQDRPMSALGVKALDKVFYGTVPDYGALGGVLAVVDGSSGTVKIHRDIVKDQSIVSLAYADGLVIGGTSVSGGLGIAPTAKEGKLFGWDSKAEHKVFEISPVPGAKLVSGLVVSRDGKVFGAADGELFVFDPVHQKIIARKKLFAVDPEYRHAGWRDAMTALHPDGSIYGTQSGRLFRINPASLDIQILRQKDSQMMAIDDAGRVYFRDVTHLWQYTP